MTGLVFKTVWRQDDPGLMEEAKAFWARTGLVAENHRWRRARELGVMIYAGEALVGIATAELETLPGLGARFAVVQGVVEPAFRRQSISMRALGLFREVLEDWSLANPEENVMGMAGVVEAAEYAEKSREPVWNDHGCGLTLVGHTAHKRQQIRVTWFAHARL